MIYYRVQNIYSPVRREMEAKKHTSYLSAWLARLYWWMVPCHWSLYPGSALGFQRLSINKYGKPRKKKFAGWRYRVRGIFSSDHRDQKGCVILDMGTHRWKWLAELKAWFVERWYFPMRSEIVPVLLRVG